MLFADIGYAILREDVVQESSWNDYSNYYKSVGRGEKLVGENLLAWPEKNQYEFGDSVIVGTIQQSDFRTTRVVYLGDFTYSKAGRLIGKNLSGQYIWSYGHDDSTYGTGALRSHHGVVKSFSPRFYFDMLNYAKSEKEFEEYQSSDQVIHEFGDGDDHGLGREAFADPVVSKYFQEGWYLNPFGSDLNRVNGSLHDYKFVGTSGSDILKGYFGDNFGKDLLEGGDGSDLLVGYRGADTLDGGQGDDTLMAGNGRDIITGGAGGDTMYGGFGLNTFEDEADGAVDTLYFKSDQWAENWLYGKAGNSPNGQKADKITELDSFDRIYIQGVATSQLTYGNASHQSNLDETLSGIGIYASGYLEAVYVGDNLNISQLKLMTQGII